MRACGGRGGVDPITVETIGNGCACLTRHPLKGVQRREKSPVACWRVFSYSEL